MILTMKKLIFSFIFVINLAGGENVYSIFSYKKKKNIIENVELKNDEALTFSGQPPSCFLISSDENLNLQCFCDSKKLSDCVSPAVITVELRKMMHFPHLVTGSLNAAGVQNDTESVKTFIRLMKQLPTKIAEKIHPCRDNISEVKSENPDDQCIMLPPDNGTCLLAIGPATKNSISYTFPEFKTSDNKVVNAADMNCDLYQSGNETKFGCICKELMCPKDEYQKLARLRVNIMTYLLSCTSNRCKQEIVKVHKCFLKEANNRLLKMSNVGNLKFSGIGNLAYQINAPLPDDVPVWPIVFSWMIFGLAWTMIIAFVLFGYLTSRSEINTLWEDDVTAPPKPIKRDDREEQSQSAVFDSDRNRVYSDVSGPARGKREVKEIRSSNVASRVSHNDLGSQSETT